MLRRLLEHLEKKSRFKRVTQSNDLKIDYALNKMSVDLMHSIFIQREYADYFPFYQNAVIVDIGAHKGYFTLFAAQNTDKNSKIVSVEPVSSNFKILEKNVQRNENKNLTLVKAAVAAFDGQLEIRLSHDTNHSIIGENPLSGKSNAIEKVKAITLDSLFKNYGLIDVDFLKMDCEGAEYDILFNATFEALKRIKILSLEFHDLKNSEKSASKLIDFMKSKQFEVVKFQYEPTNLGLNFGKLIFKRINLE